MTNGSDKGNPGNTSGPWLDTALGPGGGHGRPAAGAGRVRVCRDQPSVRASLFGSVTTPSAESTGGVPTPSASSVGVVPGSASVAAGGGERPGGGATVRGGGANGGLRSRRSRGDRRGVQRPGRAADAGLVTVAGQRVDGIRTERRLASHLQRRGFQRDLPHRRRRGGRRVMAVADAVDRVGARAEVPGRRRRLPGRLSDEFRAERHGRITGLRVHRNRGRGAESKES